MTARQGRDVREAIGEEPRRPPARADSEDLLALAISQPSLAVTTAHRILAGHPTHRERSLAHHAITIVERDRGRIPQAIEQARAALAAGRRAGPDREAEVRATFGTTLLFAGATSKALLQLNRALTVAPGDAVARVLHLRGCTFWLLGRYGEAIEDLSRAIELSRARGDKLWEGRSLGSRGDARRALGDSAGSAQDYEAAERVHLEIGEVVEATLSARNRALVALQEGDVVDALRLMDEAEKLFRGAGVDPVEQLLDHATALLTARLTTEAQTLIDSALDRDDLAPVWRADLLLHSARAALLQEEWDAASSRALDAKALFEAHRRARWAARSELLALEAAQAARRVRSDEDTSDQAPPSPTPGLLDRTQRLVGTLRRLGDPTLTEALLLLAEVAGEAGRDRLSRQALAEAAAKRHVGAPLPRAAGWLAAARLAQRQHDRRTLRLACRRGLDAVDEHRALMGDLEMRALAGGYGLDLVTLAHDDAASARDARAVLWWTERWRATALTGAATRPPEDPELRRDVAALRDVSRRLGTDDGGGHLERERSRLEAAVRTRYRRLRAEGDQALGPDLPRLIECLGDTVLLSITSARNRLYAVTVAGGRVRLRTLGDSAAALREAQFARFSLRRAAHGRDIDLQRAGLRLQEALLGEPDAAWSSGSVLVVPPGQFLTVPFGLLPVFRETAVRVSPSAGLWMRARAERLDTGSGHVALVTGPGLSTEQQEVTQLQRLHTDATVLGGADATVDRALAAIDGARVAHIAAHGTFRADAPLFSSLLLADGPLMVHDLDRLRVPPESVILSACDSGGVHPITAHEALGLVSSLLALGTRSVVASVDPINDAATAAVMTPLHTTIAAGGALAEGLLAARTAAGDDSLLSATAAAFNAWGA